MYFQCKFPLLSLNASSSDWVCGFLLNWENLVWKSTATPPKVRGYGFEGNIQYFPCTFTHGFWDFGKKWPDCHDFKCVCFAFVSYWRSWAQLSQLFKQGGGGDSSKCGFPQNALGNGILQHQCTYKILDLITIADLKRFTITPYGLRPREMVGWAFFWFGRQNNLGAKAIIYSSGTSSPHIMMSYISPKHRETWRARVYGEKFKTDLHQRLEDLFSYLV